MRSSCIIKLTGSSLGYSHFSRLLLYFLCIGWPELQLNIEKGGHPMSYQDKSIQCSDCNTIFTFSATEQEQFASRGYTNEPNAVPHAVRQGKHNRMEAAVIVAVVMETEATVQPHGRCFPWNAPHVAKTLRCLLNPVVIDQSTVQIVTAKLTQ